MNEHDDNPIESMHNDQAPGHGPAFWDQVQAGLDTTAAERARQKRRLPTALITTPESASLLLSYPGNRETAWMC